MGVRRYWRSASVLATADGISDGTAVHPDDKRATTPETAYGCTGGAKL
jgi:hypothetical protein